MDTIAVERIRAKGSERIVATVRAEARACLGRIIIVSLANGDGLLCRQAASDGWRLHNRLQSGEGEGRGSCIHCQ